MARRNVRRSGLRVIRSKWAQAAAGLALWAGGGSLGSVALAQMPEPAAMTATEKAAPTRYHLNKHTIQLPIQLKDEYRPFLHEIHLYCKESASAPWTLREKAPATQSAFTFKAPQDGEYWFAMVTVDRQGKSVPADITKEEPAMVIVVDSQPPQPEVMLLGTVPEGQLIQCDVRDAHPDLSKTRLQYQTADKAFRDLEAVADHPNLFCIPAQANTTGMIRVHASDLAGNVATRDYSVAQLPGPANKGSAATLPGTLPLPLQGPPETRLSGPQLSSVEKTTVEPGPSLVKPPVMPEIEPTAPPKQLNIGPAAGGMVAQAPPLSEGSTSKPPAEIQQTSAKQVTAGSTSTPEAKREAAHHLVVNSTRLFLEYRMEKVGASGVGHVEIWSTRDKRQSWQKIGEDATRKGPAEVRLPGEGLYGLSLIASNGLGFGAEPPAAGAAPQWWIEVDTTKPIAQLTQVKVMSEGGMAVQIGWTSHDNNLGPAPAELSYSVSRQGPWLPVASGLKGEGQFRWVPPADAGQHVYIRLTVRDLAGNTTITETTQPITLDDLSRPQAHIAGVTTDAVPPAPKAGQ